MTESNYTTNIARGASIAPDSIFLAVLVALSVWGASHVSSDMDAGRDAFFAWGIAQGDYFPLSGPPLAQSIHAGPIWFYFLAIPLAIVPSWSALTLWAAAFASTKYILAYLIGREIHSRSVGLLWAALLALPGWHLINFLAFTHTIMIEAATLACLFCTVKWVKTSRPAWLIGVAFSFSLALHAHPSTYYLALIIAPLLVLLPARKSLSVKLITIALTVFVLPLLPYIYEQSILRWPDLSGGLSYIDKQPIVHSLLQIDDLVRGVFVGGWSVGLHSVAGLAIEVLPNSLYILYASFALAAIGLFNALNKPDTRKIVCVAIYSMLIGFVGVALIRETTPSYMTYSLYPIIAGVMAISLANLPFARKSMAVVAMAALTVSLVITATGAKDASDNGLLAFPKHAGDVRLTPPVELRTSFYFPVGQQGELGKFVCDNQPAVLHGFAATITELSYGTAASMECGLQLADIKLGGASSSAWDHWHGMPFDVALALGLNDGIDVGNLIFFPVNPHFPASPRKSLDPRRYPMRDFLAPPNKDSKISLELPATHILAISNIAYYFMRYVVSVELNGKK